MHYYTHNIGDFAMETRGLSYEEIGIYITLIDRYASTQKPLGEAWISLAYRGESNSKALALLEAFFVRQEGGWAHPRIADLISKFAETSEKRRAAGAKGGRRKADSSTVASALEDSDGVKQEPGNCLASAVITNNHKPINQEPIDIERADALSAQAQAQAPASTPKTTRRKASSACQFLPGAEIPDDYREVATKSGVANPQACFEKFVNHALANDRRLVDWKAGFRNWCANELAYHPKQPAARKPLSQRTAADYADWLS
nr:MAG TPA: Protein of unknown function (DUF1376) [Bacteriophage sp.]